MKKLSKIIALLFAFSIFFTFTGCSKYLKSGNIFEILKIDKDDFNIIAITVFNGNVSKNKSYSANITKDNHYEIFTDLIDNLQKTECTLNEILTVDPNLQYLGRATDSVYITLKNDKITISEFELNYDSDSPLLFIKDKSEMYNEQGKQKENAEYYDKYIYDFNRPDFYKLFWDICIDY